MMTLIVTELRSSEEEMMGTAAANVTDAAMMMDEAVIRVTSSGNAAVLSCNMSLCTQQWTD